MAKRIIRVTAGKRSVTAVDEIIGKRLRARRLEQNVSQEVLGTQLGITFQQVQKYEKGVNRIGSARLVDIARILQVDTAYFLTDLKGGGNGTGKTTESRFLHFMATKDGVDINDAMMKLSTAHRKSVIDLARVLVRAYGE